MKELGVEEDIRRWLDQINRGGLFQVNKEFDNLIFQTELIARTVININLLSTYAGENIKEMLKKKISSKHNCPGYVEKAVWKYFL